MLRHAAPYVLFVILVTVFTYPLCGLMFRCGCVSAWGGAADHCNIHLAGAFHCPWCQHAGLGGMGFGLMIGGQALAFALVRRRGASVRPAIVAALVAWPLAALLAGGLTFLLTDYPHFLVLGARARISLPPGPISAR